MNNKTTLWALVAVVVVALLAWWFLSKNESSNSTDYKAVFLSNGQLYFGKVADEKSDPVVLTDIYYLRAQRQVQPVPEGDQQQQQQPQVSLVKFGKGEVHGPEDEMRVNREQILYIETLRAKSKVVEAIKDYQKSLEDDEEKKADEEKKDDEKQDEEKKTEEKKEDKK